MISIVEGNIVESKENIVVSPVNCSGELNGFVTKFEEMYGTIEKEYMRYINKYHKKNLDMLGGVQYVPVDSWAMVMVDTIKNNRIEAYDSNYQYIANAFIRENNSKDGRIDMIAVRRCLIDIREKAESINATVAIPYKFACGKYTSWNDINKIIENVFGKSNIDVKIYKKKK